VAAGAALFGLFVWRPAWKGTPDASRESDALATRLLRLLALAGIGSLALATLVFGLYSSWQASGGFSLSALHRFAAGRSGLVLGARLVLLVALALTIRYLPSLGNGSLAPWWVAAALGQGVLLTFSLQSHSAALGSPLAIVLDWLHLAAFSAWMGGLLPLALLATRAAGGRPGGLPLAHLVPRFSRVALASVTALALTGLYSALLHVQTLEALGATLYGRAVIAKTVLVAALILLGAINLLLLSRRLGRSDGSAVRWLARTVRIELALGLLVVGAAGVLTGVSPALEALQALRREGWVSEAQSNQVRLTLWVAPRAVGENEFAVDVVDSRPNMDEEPQVLLRLRQPAGGGITQIETATEDGRRFTARGSYFGRSGTWEMEVIVRRAGFDDVRHVFTTEVESRPP
jgi:copper transport protein